MFISHLFLNHCAIFLGIVVCLTVHKVPQKIIISISNDVAQSKKHKGELPACRKKAMRSHGKNTP